MYKAIDIRKRGRSGPRWLRCLQRDLFIFKISNQKPKAKSRTAWNNIVKEGKNPSWAVEPLKKKMSQSLGNK